MARILVGRRRHRFRQVKPQIDELRAQARCQSLTINTGVYTYEPTYQQALEFRQAAERGAAIVRAARRTIHRASTLRVAQ
jgi:hypothetical protein